MKLGELAGREFSLDAATARIAITGICADSRSVRPGFLFAALAGSRADGAAFVAQAIDKGAAAVLAAPGRVAPGLAVPVIEAAEPRAALARMAARFHPRQPETMVAVTGTAGKTSVAAFTRQIWERGGRAAASIGTTGVVAPGTSRYANLTTPDPIELHRLLDELAGAGVTHAAMEASSHGLDQHRLDGVRLAAGAFTNLGRDHMDYHPTVEAYFEAKMRLFRDLLGGGKPAVIFADDAWSQKAIAAARQAGCAVRTVGRGGQFICLKRVEHERFRQVAEVQMGADLHRIEFPLAGDFQIANGLVAAGLAIATGTEPAAAFGALERLRGAAGRLELVGTTPAGAPVYVDYAHKPEAMENVLRSLRPFTSGRLIIVFGCGGDRDPGKRPIMGEVASRLADTVIVTDDNPRSEQPAAIRAAIMAAAPGAIEIADRRQAIERAVAMLGEGDCLVVAGKGHEEGQIIGDRVLPFSDHAVVRQALGGAEGAGRAATA
ncbi:MAG: UDP-N-acetylmuramoyl-L-alanyl-D-glutamate--2,6-diaminopimelate ligase [Alphaproteobacteria bacterium]|nr:MAG: UDP-N-acetylmuramoyl-L-alanyl-D-glutamate--2,6-diaminopimelate ligase [Alphaproteobacteria bacterium]